ncbi:putative DNA primase/helicase [Faunimonas pinastri]|uniref:Putative DNA primase/helicase n=1 Tax=Faunimonas pinastri TaxID=1855383 RepID=A0A1H9F863_9HYPH|nr:phage/plasmid primase, P4 family [Faunimonas pinastri]SEQ33623.1 putative DNA primase/helicase [Faunimonas pinastri]
MPDMIAHALGYGLRGWPVFPCHPNTKQPLTEHGLKNASADPERIRAWWKKHPNAMIGVPTGAPIGAFVVDLDPKDGATAEGLLGLVIERLAELRAEGEGVDDAAGFAAALEQELSAPFALPPCPMVRTPRGGLHLWFAMPDGLEIGNRAGVIPDVDVRGTGGYVILPPSTRRGRKAKDDGCDGVAYLWEEDSGLDDFDPPAAPPELIRFVLEKHRRDAPQAAAVSPAPSHAAGADRAHDDERIRRYGLSALDNELRELERAGRGTRGHTLNKCGFVLGQLVGAGVLTESVVVAGMRGAVDRNGLAQVDGWVLVDRNIERSIRAGMDSPRDLAEIARGNNGRRPGAALRAPLPSDPPEGPSLAGPAAPQSAGKPDSRRANEDVASAREGDGEEPEDGDDDPVDDGSTVQFDDLDPERLARAAAEPQNDTGNARRLRTWFGDDILNVRDVGQHVWAGAHWDAQGGDEAMQRYAQIVAERIVAEADVLAAMPWEETAIEAGRMAEKKAVHDRDESDLTAIEAAKVARKALGGRKTGRRKFAISCGNTSRLNGMIAQALPHCTVAPDDLDVEPLAMNVRNGTLRMVKVADPECPDPDATREIWQVRLDPHRRDDRISKLMPVAYDPEATCPTWAAFMERFQPNPGIRRFLQVYHGLALTGIVEQAFVLNYGLGANGKSTYMEALARLMGSYAQTLPAEALTGELQRRGDQATPEFARLPGARMVRCAELPRGQGFRENTLKMLTGGEKMPVRHLHGRFFDLIPAFKAVGSCNEKPDIGGIDEGIWRRVKLIPWTVTIPPAERRPMEQVLAEFAAESAGILNWLLEGLLAYLEGGLVVPPEIHQATESYRADMDPLGEFLTACVEPAEGHDETARDVYLAYSAWCHASSVRPYSEKTFAVLMPQKGIEKISGRIRKYKNVRLHDVPEDPTRQKKSSGDRWEDSF